MLDQYRHGASRSFAWFVDSWDSKAIHHSERSINHLVPYSLAKLLAILVIDCPIDLRGFIDGQHRAGRHRAQDARAFPGRLARRPRDRSVVDSDARNWGVPRRWREIGGLDLVGPLPVRVLSFLRVGRCAAAGDRRGVVYTRVGRCPSRGSAVRQTARVRGSRALCRLRRVLRPRNCLARVGNVLW